MIATTLLLGMAGGTVFCLYLPPSYAARLAGAATRAGLVGGLADWFAVTALFRHPLGLPIPHTAIIPNEKTRLGQALGRFVARHVMNKEEVTRVIARFDIGGFLKLLLNDPAIVAPLSRSLAGMVPRLLASVEDGRARRLVSRLAPRMLGGPAAGRVVARVLRTLVEGGRHQEVLTFVIGKMRELMLAKEPQLRDFIQAKVREQGGRVVGWALGATVANRVLTLVNAEMEHMGPDSAALRDAFDEWARTEITRMEEDPERAAEIGRALRRVLSHDTVQAWAWDVWSRLRLTLEADSARPNGRTMAILENAIHSLGDILAQDQIARDRVQRLAEKLVAGLLPAAQTQIADFIAKVVASWDTETIVDRLELRVGRDLQYVRMNGTLVGALAGGVLFALLHAAGME